MRLQEEEYAYGNEDQSDAETGAAGRVRFQSLRAPPGGKYEEQDCKRGEEEREQREGGEHCARLWPVL